MAIQPPNGTYISSAGSGGFSGTIYNTIGSTFKVTNPDFTVKTTISDEIRKYEPRQFYLVLELLAAHIENFKGDFPGYPGLSYKAHVSNLDDSNELRYTITFTKEEQ